MAERIKRKRQTKWPEDACHVLRCSNFPLIDVCFDVSHYVTDLRPLLGFMWHVRKYPHFFVSDVTPNHREKSALCADSSFCHDFVDKVENGGRESPGKGQSKV